MFTANDEAMEPNAPDTSNFLNWVEIKNFKSIKDLRLDCKRVNIFIGKPNVGKSNILEALGILGADLYTDGFMKGAVRYKDLKHLFYQNNAVDGLEVRTEYLRGSLGKDQTDKDRFLYLFETNYIELENENFTKRLNLAEVIVGYSDTKNYFQYLSNAGEIKNIEKSMDYKEDATFVKKYDFSRITEFIDSFRNFLLPNGKNLFNVIDRRKDLKNEFGKLFLEQGLDLVLDQENQSFNLQRKDGFYIYKYDFYTIADTFQRFMFYIAAIESNENSVIVFEEPEVHSFPPYTQDVAYRMIYSADNQFFVSTHSPYLLQTLVENLGDDQLSVFVTYYENYETKVKALTAEELSFVQEYSTDVFFNLDRFIPTPNATSVS